MRGPWQWMMFLILFHAMLSLFTTVGLFGLASSQGVEVSEWGITDVASFIGISGFGGIGGLALGSLAAIVAVRAGLNPFICIAYGIVTSLYVSTWTRLFNIINKVASSMGDFSFILYFFGVVLATMFGYLVIKTLIDMTASPSGGT